MVVRGSKYNFTINGDKLEEFIALVRELDCLDGAKLPDGSFTSDLGEYFEKWYSHDSNFPLIGGVEPLGV